MRIALFPGTSWVNAFRVQSPFDVSKNKKVNFFQNFFLTFSPFFEFLFADRRYSYFCFYLAAILFLSIVPDEWAFHGKKD